MNAVTETKSTDLDNKRALLTHLLAALQLNLEDLKNDVDQSYELFKVGVKTDMLQKLEGILDDPIQSIFDVSLDVDTKAKDIINQLVVRDFFLKKRDLIHKAGRVKSFSGSLYYAIVLNEDTTDNRSLIFDFFDHYDLLKISKKFPVYFQFVPKHLEDKVYFEEVFDLK